MLSPLTPDDAEFIPHLDRFGRIRWQRDFFLALSWNSSGIKFSKSGVGRKKRFALMMYRMELDNGKLIRVEDGTGNIYVYINPDEQDRKQLVETLNLDEHTLASALDPDELARLEFEPEHLAVIFKRPRNYSSEDRFVFKVASTGLFLFSDKLIIVLGDDVSLFQGKQFTKVTSLQDLMLEDDLQFDLPFQRTPEDHQYGLRRPRRADQRFHAE